MPRGLGSTLITALQSPAVRVIVLYEGEFVSGTLRLWSGLGELSWNGETWTGGGNLVGVGPVAESGGLQADGISVSLSGIPADLLAKALGEVRHSHTGKLWFGLLDDAGAVTGTPTLLYQGRLDTTMVKRGRTTATIALTYENQALTAQARERRYTHEDQQIDYPGDLGFQYVTGLQKKPLAGAGGGLDRTRGTGGGDGGRDIPLNLD